MPRPQDIAPTYEQVIEKILRETSAPMPVLELAQKISAERPSTAKDPVKEAKKKIKEAAGRQLVYLDANTILPLRIAWQGVRFRIDLSREEVNKGFFDAGATFSYYLPYHWVMLLANDERMETNGWDTVYRDGATSMLDALLDEISGTKPKPHKKPISKEQKDQVFRFKAELKYRPRIWRLIEIQGKNTLSDFNEILVDVFDHDFDHLGGFWKLVPRGGAKRGVARYREVDLGSVDPFGEGDAADVTIAELELEVGSKMKYVFDFGDWIEHVLTLEAIEPPQPKAEYPREVKRNTPKYDKCVECLKKGKESTAIYVCVTCTKGPEQERLLCEDCAEKHEIKDHLVEKILY